ncbi:MAG: DUF1304 domain-containing protein [Ancrocorticia sp.]|jgi:putative membrane protein|nr:DUF1304 domain-containing protein [Ancrocorticia sp.]MCI1896675.1 DUF1304 domain-containing protein [Ancrocorticia sp.]MCI1932243.1 DUF1304 domain-containing protein [Ancrocorticia sp.]MCI1963056.1 DUF1304 domain-containing protein [Ancrocorticia sp.]MCI2001424.1 DUF1304 domain-containing protein [Ancrocorticia sp.]
MFTVGLILAGLAGALHIYIFLMESAWWTRASVRSTFGMTEEEAESTKEMAFNQGFYNLFLAVMVFVGIVVVLAGNVGGGAALILAGTVSMTGAATVLLLSSPQKASAALKQGILPLVGTIVLAIGLL